MTLYIGIDPGKRGALAFVSETGEALQAIAMPLIKASKGGRDEFDLPLIRDILEHNRRGQPRFVTIEKLHPMPPRMGGSVANFARGESRVLVGLLVGLRIPYQLVPPQAWQRVMHQGTSGRDTKQRSIIAAQRLFPLADLRRTPACKEAHDGIADAYLIAEYSRRTRVVTAARWQPTAA